MNIKKIGAILISIFFLFILAQASSAQLVDTGSAINDNANLVRSSGGLGNASVGSIVATLIQAILGLLAIIFLVLMVFSGFQWMTASGNETKIKKAQDTIIAAVIGLVVVLAAYAITYYIFKYLPFSGSSVAPSTQGGTSG
jgi:hypothetical protein